MIAERLLITTGSMTSLLDTLPKRGLIRRLPHPVDRRKLLVDITPDAQEIVDEFLPSFHAREHELISAALTTSEQRQLLRLVAKIQQAAIRAGPAPPIRDAHRVRRWKAVHYPGHMGEQQMSYGIIHQFKGATREQYEASVAAVHPSDGTLPAGQLYHFAGPSADGWVVVAVHDSKESWESLRDSILMPSLQRGIEGGFTAPPEETVFKIDADLSAPAIGVAVAAHGTEPSHSPRGEPGRQPPGVACAAHVFAAHVRADPGLVWTALTDPGQTAAYLYGLAAHSTWIPGDPIEFRLGGRAEAIGRVLHARCHERLSYLLQAGPGDPPVYLTWLLRPAPGGSVVRLEIDQVDHADSPQEAEDVWLPVLAALQLLVNPA